jgi:hypothetical protein
LQERRAGAQHPFRVRKIDRRLHGHICRANTSPAMTMRRRCKRERILGDIGWTVV